MIRLFWMVWVLASRLRPKKKRPPLVLVYPVAPENPLAPTLDELEPPPDLSPFIGEVTYQYAPDPEPDTHPLLREPGVIPGYVVIHHGVGPAKIARTTALVGDDGEVVFENPDGGDGLEFTDCTVVDDTDRIDP